MKETILGIDEAGRGPVLGPLVMAAVLHPNEQEIKQLGVKDSKLLSHAERINLSTAIQKTATNHLIIALSPQEIDQAVQSDESNLNLLEARTTAKLINELNPTKAYIDCPSRNIEAYASYLRSFLINKNIELVCEHKADTRYPLVAAASIIAKVTRDREIERLKKKYDVDFGSGYPSDPYTKQFLQENFNTYPFFRKSWSSWKSVAQQKNQKKLFEF